MSIEPPRRTYRLEARFWSRRSVVLRWYLRLQLRWVCADIDRLTRQLAGEFGTLDTAPLVSELETLTARREQLVKILDSA